MATAEPCSVQLHLRTHRLATTLWARQQHDEVVAMLQHPLDHFRRHLPKDPLTGECQLVSCVSQIALLDRRRAGMDAMLRVLAPKRRAQLARSAREGLWLMERGFQADHVLVQRARSVARSAMPDSPELLLPVAPQ